MPSGYPLWLNSYSEISRAISIVGGGGNTTSTSSLPFAMPVHKTQVSKTPTVISNTLSNFRFYHTPLGTPHHISRKIDAFGDSRRSKRPQGM